MKKKILLLLGILIFTTTICLGVGGPGVVYKAPENPSPPTNVTIVK